MMCDNEILRTPNLFVRKLIMVLFLAPFILINGGIGVRGNSGELVAPEARVASELGHIGRAHKDNEQRDNNGRFHRRQPDTTPHSHNVSDAFAGAALKSESQPDNLSSEIVEEYDAESNENHTVNENGEKILSRRRRYLIFPPGSSVQIVFDTYHPILGYSNYLIIGLTAALAWELPSKPVYLDEELHESYQMGDLPLLKRKDQNVSNVTYTSTNKQSSQAANSYSSVPSALSTQYYYTNVPSLSNRYPTNRLDYNTPNKNLLSNRTAAGQSDKMQYYLSYADRFMSELRQLTQSMPKDAFNDMAKTVATKMAPTERKTFTKTTPRKHLVHPVFKKRSIDKLDKLEKYDLKLHRVTRHKLYQQIEKFLKTQGSNGMDCVLKTLCETGQRDTNEKPSSMIVELLRAIFTLPEGLDRADDPIHRMYDKAHRSRQNCQKMFPACIESIWGPKLRY